MRRAAALATASLVAWAGLPALAASADGPGDEPYRPAIHYTPDENWMNDPNGMVYVDGTYHLYYQHNPEGDRWGNMSWGHATSDDLLHWEEQEIAIRQSFDDQGRPIEDIFSGSVVVDEENSSGFGVGDEAPLVAIYTSAYTSLHPTHAGKQAQSLAYSTDGGYTWTKFSGNPVLDRNSANFRDPKVFWYEGETDSYWVMVTVEAVDHKVVLYKSDNLISWDHLSDFGPANSVGGIWECPDLIELPVDGDSENTKWVMVVNLNPGSVNGGSGGQYFVGDFDGTTFTSDTTDGPATAPVGTVFAGFDGGTFEGWTVDNDDRSAPQGPWGTGPAGGSLPGQNTVNGWQGAGLVNGFVDGDWPVGTMESPAFTIDSRFINLLVGGGRHPHVPNSQLGNQPPAGVTLFDFEADGNLAENGWQLTGDFATEPWRSPSTQGGEFFLGAKRINTYEAGPLGDNNLGDLTSPEFVIDGSDISFLIGGGMRNDGSLEAQLIVNGEVIRSQTGRNSGALNWASWDVSDLEGATARFRVHDGATGGWGHLTLDQVVIGDEAALIRSEETSVNLVVDGEIVRSATGTDSENLDWTTWNVSEFEGQQATIRAIDNNGGGWGHLLFDQVMFSESPTLSQLEGYDWLDWGRDYYATVSYFGTPDGGSRIMQGWMNNWDYANDIPTSPWRSSMTLPREVTLVTTPEGPRLSQKVIEQIDGQLQHENAETRLDVAVDGVTDLGLSGDVVKLDVTLNPGDADRIGISVFGDDETGTIIGYDTELGRLFIDRRNSGNVSFHPAFASQSDVPLAPSEDGSVTLEVYLDRASVELFADDGLRTITEQVFPRAGATAIRAWSEGGEGTIESITVTPITPTMRVPDAPDGITVDRVAGANRYEVAVNISQEAYPDTAPVVYVASGENYPDALSAGPAAGFEGGPLLLVKPNELPAVVSAEIARLDPAKIVVVGGTVSVTEGTFNDLDALTDEIVRIAGANRYEVSRNVAEYAFGGADVPLAYVATGEKFPDALAAGGAAGSQDAPVLLVKGSASDLDAETEALLDDLGATETRVLGGEASVTPGVFDALAAVTDATRLGGANRYEAARTINADAFDEADRAFIATGLNFPDALAGSAWAAASGSPMYVVPGTCVTAGVLADLETLGVSHVTLLGGEASLSPEVFSLASCG